MIRTLMAAAAVSGLMLSTALAQDPAKDPNQGAGKSGAGISSSGMTAGSITSPSSNHWLGSQLTGSDVVGANNEKIGKVSDILLDKSGKVDALIVAVGGFFGLGGKEIALPMTVFVVKPANSAGNESGEDQFQLPMTKQELQQNAEFNRNGESSTTTGAGSGAPANPPAAPPTPPAPSR